MNAAQTDRTGASRGSLASYATGFIFSIILTIIAFALVMNGAFSGLVVILGVVAAGVVQILAHLHFFLHLDTSSAMRWNVLALLFTVLIMTLFVGGSIWIMYNLNYRLM
jgi:cytochrome o ubiquinol oxidase subunit IV